MSAYSRRGPDPLEQGLDRLVSAGRQFVDGVSGARPGSRPPARGAGRRSGSLPRLDELGRWVEDKLDWIRDDEDDWREPWQEQRPSRRQPLEAISRRSLPQPAPSEASDWPDDDSFTVQRWQRPAQAGHPPLRPGEAIPNPQAADSSPRPAPRAMPRSSRRRGA